MAVMRWSPDILSAESGVPLERPQLPWFAGFGPLKMAFSVVVEDTGVEGSEKDGRWRGLGGEEGGEGGWGKGGRAGSKRERRRGGGRTRGGGRREDQRGGGGG